MCLNVYFCKVELKEYVKLGQCVYAINKGDGCSQINFEPDRDIPDSSNSVSSNSTKKNSKHLEVIVLFLSPRKILINCHLLC